MQSYIVQYKIDPVSKRDAAPKLTIRFTAAGDTKMTKQTIKLAVKAMFRANRILVKTNTKEASKAFKQAFFAVIEMTGCNSQALLTLIRVDVDKRNTAERLAERRVLEGIFANPEKYL